MIHIYICEDSNVQRDQMVTYVSDFLLMENLDMDLRYATGNPIELLENIEDAKETGIYFLDVDLQHEMNGIQLAAEIRKCDPRGIIIFITSHSEMTYLTFMYKVEAMDFIIKDNINDIRSRMVECIRAANERFSIDTREGKKRFQMKVQDKFINVSHEEIMFFESSPQRLHKVHLHLENGIIEFYGKLQDVESLDENFFRCHKSFIVNVKSIKEIDLKKKLIHMMNGEKCFGSYRLIKQLVSQLPDSRAFGEDPIKTDNLE